MDNLVDLIRDRVSPAQLGEPGPSPEQLRLILEAGSRAPDHGRMQPWRFITIEGDARHRLGEVLARALRKRDPSSPEAALEHERKKPLRAPLVVVVAAVIAANPKVPAVEQMIAAGAAAQNIVLACHALGFGAFWRTGAPAYDADVKEALGLTAHDALIGFLHIGTIVVPGKSKPPEIESVTRRW
jgi:nitroreductase